MKNLSAIFRLCRPLYPLIGLIAFLIVAAAVLELVAPIISKSIVDEIVAHVNHQSGDLNKLIILISLTFISSFINLLFSVLSERYGDVLSFKLRKFLTEKFYDKVLRLPQSYFDGELSGKIVHQLNRGIVSIQDFVNTSTNFLIPTLLQSIFTIGVLAYYNALIAFLTFLLFPIYLILSYYSAKKWGKDEVKKNEIEDTARGRVHEVISNMALVKSFNTQFEEFKFLTTRLNRINTIYDKQSKTYHWFDFARGLSLNLILLIVSILIFYNTFKGLFSIGEMVLLLQLFALARRPLFAMSFILTRIQTAEAGAKEFLSILSLPAAEEYVVTKKMEKLKHAEIEFKSVSFSYESSEKVLDEVSFVISPGEKVALVGHSGAGKSTIINLILKFYDPTSGEIFLNNIPYGKLDHAEIRENISLVFQDNELFSSTIRENISYGSNPSEAEMLTALKIANAYDFVMKLPKKLDAEIGERGVRLSGGQKQRLQIARVVLKNAPILILDEATSSLDAKSEKEVQDALEKVMQEKTVIIIAHRFSTIQNVDKIIVIDNGKVIDCGTPQELSTKKGVYLDLLNYQIEGNKKLLASFELY